MKSEQQSLPLGEINTQNWHKYNLAKTNEKRLFYELLYELCLLIPEPLYEFGRPPAAIRDMVFSLGLKLYSNYSGRKIYSDLVHAQGSNYIKKAPHFNTITDFLNDPALYDLLQKLLMVSAMPLKSLENQYSMDSSGFGSYQYERWQKAKWKSKRGYRNYLKGHILIGTKTNIICSCEITPGNLSDVRQAPKLLLKAKGNFPIKEVSADKAYSSKRVLQIIDEMNAKPFVPFKHSNVVKEESPRIWIKAFKYFKNRSYKFQQHYHKRSNVETTFSMIKMRLGEFLKCKNYASQRNELMIKFICHNICCLIQEIYERNIHVDFKSCLEKFIDRKVESEYPTTAEREVEF